MQSIIKFLLLLCIWEVKLVKVHIEKKYFLNYNITDIIKNCKLINHKCIYKAKFIYKFNTLTSDII